MKYHAHKKDNDIIVECGHCDTKHTFTFHAFGRYFLENAPFVSVGPHIEDDLFEVDGGVMHPIWVCRNAFCKNESIIRIKNINEEQNEGPDELLC